MTQLFRTKWLNFLGQNDSFFCLSDVLPWRPNGELLHAFYGTPPQLIKKELACLRAPGIGSHSCGGPLRRGTMVMGAPRRAHRWPEVTVVCITQNICINALLLSLMVMRRAAECCIVLRRKCPKQQLLFSMEIWLANALKKHC